MKLMAYSKSIFELNYARLNILKSQTLNTSECEAKIFTIQWTMKQYNELKNNTVNLLYTVFSILWPSLFPIFQITHLIKTK